ncbi:NMD3 family protein [Cardiosporidium cionae]|uniref:60S ribosomal export protein NMD3 n=1 Tax=Cardiosporidium cionae TaxID=476202 RepID=A0ABQ7JAB2_9APIC|nr:NMD3 family protein [Cardiosporidium cionae]|eukprot:KAF8820940.1 NMD3 family protein [Cardiosporidium cionae]
MEGQMIADKTTFLSMPNEMAHSMAATVAAIDSAPFSPIPEYPSFLCYLCGLAIPPNPTRMCINCVRSEVDITAGVSRTILLNTCKDCKRYLFHKWMQCEAESKELLTFCLKRIRGLHKVRITDAQFLWTEPHSKRLKIKLTIQKGILNGAILQQTFTIDFVLQSGQCPECKRMWTPHTWNARVQLRQRTEHKRTFLYLEQLILKHDAHETVINIEEHPDGLDFHFTNRNHAQKFLEFVSSHFIVRSKLSKELISRDANSNTYFNKYTYFAELCPICKDDLVWLPPKLVSHFGGISSFLLCYNVGTTLAFVDPFSLQTVEVYNEKYWKKPFQSVFSRRNLTEFIILDIDENELSSSQEVHSTSKHKQHGSKFRNVTCEIARAADFGYNDDRVTVRCHLGNSLKVGNWCLGYDMTTLILPGREEHMSLMVDKLPCDMILVKRSPSRVQKAGKRPWVLQHLPKSKVQNVDSLAMEIDDNGRDMVEFQNDIEGDPEMRKTINLLLNPAFDITNYHSEEQEVQLEELMEGLTLGNDKDLENQDDTDDQFEI